MQLTRFDRWLREKYVYETHIHTLRPPPSLPHGVREVLIPDIAGRRYKHLFVAKSSKLADQLILLLKENSQMYTTQVVDRKGWYVPFIAPKNKSVTWWITSTILILIGSVFLLLYLNSFAEDSDFMKNFNDALRLFSS
jgi:hypothetical protein